MTILFPSAMIAMSLCAAAAYAAQEPAWNAIYWIAAAVAAVTFGER